MQKASCFSKKNGKKICIITGTRAEWGLLEPLAREINSDPDLKLQLIATGMHLSPEFGLTYQEIEKEFRIDKKIEILLSADTPTSLCKSMGLAQILIADAYTELSPDIVVVLGDRYEIFACVASAMICRIPVAHIAGGERTEGAFDEAIRHSITKMSILHFTSTEEYRNRIIQLGEHPSRVFNVGGFGIDNIKSLPLLSKEKLQKELNFEFQDHNFLITFHPVTLENSTAQQQFTELLKALKRFAKDKKVGMIFTKANSDTDGRIINQMIDEFVSKHPHTISFTSMGQLRYLSTMQYVSAVVGNSSSGLAEAPAFKIGTINIGDRQKGRIKASSVIDCLPNQIDILRAFDKLFSTTFQASLPNTINPYGEGGSAKETKEILKNIKLEGILKKEFWDIKF
ncbi:UDP-N-acetylglucosamine 2-epimerase [Helicobacter pametensis]|uniref:UDP-N-acetylglucosamine 2-epimerase n=1 Tax=Helicobacter pametensis TaxID=95149 RepID=UPI0004B6837C|nr:UDP-N-acetylglucosamine 2-epimerase [Helicobacter pametensis]